MAARLRWAARPATAALVLALTTACGPSDEDTPEEPTSYVALGDSYTAGPSIGAVDGDDGCFRSRNNYPHQVAHRLGLELEDVSCSSATTADATGEQHTPQGDEIDPQLDALDADTDIVTIGLGANDFNLIGRVILTCVGLTQGATTGSPCADADRAAGDQSAEASIEELGHRLDDLYADMRERTPDAKVLVVGYPQIFPASGACPQLPLAAGDVQWARGIVVGINEQLSAAAERADFTYVDTFGPTEGHDICAQEPWIAGATLAPDRKGQPWHPYVEEQTRVADLLVAELR